MALRRGPNDPRVAGASALACRRHFLADVAIRGGPHEPEAARFKARRGIRVSRAALRYRSRRKEMLTVVVYDSEFGNTEKIAEAIGRGAGSLGVVRVMDTVEAAQTLTERPDLLLVGGPTQKRKPTPALRDFVNALPAALLGVPVASFDTRYRGSTLLMGSAAAEAAKRLRKSGPLVAPPESFFIQRGGPLEHQGLEAGELERAEGWGRAVSAAAKDEGP